MKSPPLTFDQMQSGSVHRKSSYRRRLNVVIGRAGVGSSRLSLLFLFTLKIIDFAFE